MFLLFGAGMLSFLSMDEKPYRFNGIGEDRVWAHRGQKHVKTKELRQKLLERWTGITAVIPRRPPSLHIGDHGEWLMKWVALFKGKDGSRMHLQKPSELCQLLYAEHGSVTGETWLQYAPAAHFATG